MQQAAALPTPGPSLAGIDTRKFAMWLFLASEVMFFTGLIGSYIVIRYAGGAEWPRASELLSVTLVAINTFILICSSVTMVKAYAGIENGDQKGLRTFLILTAVLGTVFVSIQAFEWSELIGEGVRHRDSLFGTTFYALTGFHGAHVSGGVLALLFVIMRAFQGAYSKAEHMTVEVMGLYWHFVDLVWIILFTLIYLI
jgi:heme/copper-type cytochrome/quinol oxidase subunit 3